MVAIPAQLAARNGAWRCVCGHPNGPNPDDASGRFQHHAPHRDSSAPDHEPGGSRIPASHVPATEPRPLCLPEAFVLGLVLRPEQYNPNNTVMFSNDGALCMEDLLELIHQRTLQGADQTCAMDWTYVGDHPTFYDVWIARGMTGDSFLEIPASGSWDRAWDLF
ncbi:glycosyltransferase family 69 protein [Alternaria alternata]|nr:glycosyltransferase family 69 protein [Alternaria alternata]